MGRDMRFWLLRLSTVSMTVSDGRGSRLRISFGAGTWRDRPPVNRDLRHAGYGSRIRGRTQANAADSRPRKRACPRSRGSPTPPRSLEISISTFMNFMVDDAVQGHYSLDRLDRIMALGDFYGKYMATAGSKK